MEIIKWFTQEECIENNKKFIEKFNAGGLDGVKDATMFYSALWGAVYLSQKVDDEDKAELWENLSDDIEEYDSIIYFIDVRENGCKHILALKGDEVKYGHYKGDYDKNDPQFGSYKHKVWMEWSPATQLQIMEGNPNTDAQFMSGTLKIDGSTKLASLPRSMIYDFFYFNGIDVE